MSIDLTKEPTARGGQRLTGKVMISLDFPLVTVYLKKQQKNLLNCHSVTRYPVILDYIFCFV